MQPARFLVDSQQAPVAVPYPCLVQTPYLTEMDTAIFDFFYNFLTTTGPVTAFDTEFHNNIKTLSHTSRYRINNAGGICSYLCFDPRFRVSEDIVSIVGVEQHDDSPVQNPKTTEQEQFQSPQSISNQCSLNPGVSESTPTSGSHSSILQSNASCKPPCSNTVIEQHQMAEEESNYSATIVTIKSSEQSSTKPSSRNTCLLSKTMNQCVGKSPVTDTKCKTQDHSATEDVNETLYNTAASVDLRAGPLKDCKGDHTSQQKVNDVSDHVNSNSATLSSAFTASVPGKLASALPALVPEQISYASSLSVTGTLASSLSAPVPGTLSSALSASVTGTLSSALPASVPGTLSSALSAPVPGTLVSALPASVSGTLSSALSAPVPGTLASALSAPVPGTLASELSAPVPRTLASALSASVTGKISLALSASIPGTLSSALPASAPEPLSSASYISVPPTLPSALSASVSGTVSSALPASVTGSLVSALPASVPGILVSALPTSVPGTLVSALPASLPGTLVSSLPASLPGTLVSALPASVPGILVSALPTSVPGSLVSSLPASVPGTLVSALPASVPGTLVSALPASVPGTLVSALPASVPGTLVSALPASVPGILVSALPASVPGTFVSALPASVPGILVSALPAQVSVCQSSDESGDDIHMTQSFDVSACSDTIFGRQHNCKTSDLSLSQHKSASTDLVPWDEKTDNRIRHLINMLAEEQLSLTDLLICDENDDSSSSAAADAIKGSSRLQDDIKLSSVRIPPSNPVLNQDPWTDLNIPDATGEEMMLKHFLFQCENSLSLINSPLQPSNSDNTSLEDSHATSRTVLTASEDASPTASIDSPRNRRRHTHTSTPNREVSNLPVDESLPDYSRPGSPSNPEEEQEHQENAEIMQEFQNMHVELKRDLDYLEQQSITQDTLDSIHQMIDQKELIVEEMKQEISRLNVHFLTAETSAEIWKKTYSSMLSEHNDLQASSQAQISELTRQLELAKLKSREAAELRQRYIQQAFPNSGTYAYSNNGTSAHSNSETHAPPNIGMDAHSNIGTHTRSNNRTHDRSNNRTHDRSNNRTHDRSNNRTHDRSNNRTHDRSNNRTHDRSNNRTHDRSNNRTHDRSNNRTHDRSNIGIGTHDRSNNRTHDRSNNRILGLFNNAASTYYTNGTTPLSRKGTNAHSIRSGQPTEPDLSSSVRDHQRSEHRHQ